MCGSKRCSFAFFSLFCRQVGKVVDHITNIKASFDSALSIMRQVSFNNIIVVGTVAYLLSLPIEPTDRQFLFGCIFVIFLSLPLSSSTSILPPSVFSARAPCSLAHASSAWS